jgi:hypothetical protein
MNTIISLTSPVLRHGAVVLTVLLGFATQAADRWTDISSPLLERLTNSGAKAAWPGGCSGVVW